ncbi:hypothetical protein MMC28_008909 [Mycoblastus sanguinarius]|nr:hypothetical protein [Mycoblastus sanguinarius]
MMEQHLTTPPTPTSTTALTASIEAISHQLSLLQKISTIQQQISHEHKAHQDELSDIQTELALLMTTMTTTQAGTGNEHAHLNTLSRFQQILSLNVYMHKRVTQLSCGEVEKMCATMFGNLVLERQTLRAVQEAKEILAAKVMGEDENMDQVLAEEKRDLWGMLVAMGVVVGFYVVLFAYAWVVDG